MTIFTIKIIACITMLFDHIKYVTPSMRNFVTIYFGRISFPLFAFLLTEGYIHTSNLKKYYVRLIVFGLISQIPFMLFRTLIGEWMMLNIMFTLLFGLATITVYDKIKTKYISIPIILLLIILADRVKVDYGWFGVSLIFILYLFKDKKIPLVISYVAIIIVYFYMEEMLIFNSNNIMRFICYNIPLLFIFLYNKKLGKKTKYFFYLFYPIHLLVFYLFNFFLVK